MVGPEEWVWLLWLGQHQQPVINLVMCLLLVQGPRESDDVCFSFSQHPNIQDMVETWLVLTMICSIVIFSFVVNCDSYENFICKCLCMNKYIALDKLFMKKCCHYLTLQLLQKCKYSYSGFQAKVCTTFLALARLLSLSAYSNAYDSHLRSHTNDVLPIGATKINVYGHRTPENWYSIVFSGVLWPYLII